VSTLDFYWNRVLCWFGIHWKIAFPDWVPDHPTFDHYTADDVGRTWCSVCERFFD
jgi:hypothetical protein